MKRFVNLMSAIVLGLTAGLLASVPAATAEESGKTLIGKIQARGSLRIGVDQGKPLVFKDASSGNWQGVFVDAVQRWADTMKVKLEPVPTTWGNMVAGLQADQFDVAIALNPTPERSLAVVFSEPLISEIGAFAVLKDSTLQRWEDINTDVHTVCVPLGAAPDLALTATKPQAKILRLKGESECQLALTSKRADAFYWAVGDLTAFAATHGNIGLVFPAVPFQRQGTAFAFPANVDLQSLASFNITLEAFINSVVSQSLKQKWGFRRSAKIYDREYAGIRHPSRILISEQE